MKQPKIYEDYLMRWCKARKETPADINIGDEPNPTVFGFTTEQEVWEAAQIRKRVFREMSRTV